MAAVTRRQYKGAAASTTLLSTINDTDVAPTCSLTAVTGWPSSAGVPFFVVIDPGTTREEKCLATISGTTLTLDRSDSTRDDTVKASHAVGAVIYPVFTATEANEVNLFASTMTTRGDLLTMGSGPTVARLAVGATSGHVLKTDGTDPSWGQVAAAGIASDAVTTAKILDANVTTAKIADSAVTSAKIANDTIVNADINSAAAIVDTKLATIATAGKVSNSATTATADAGNNTIVARGATGNFAAGTITATLTGNVTGNLTGTASNASKIDNHTVFVQSATPTALATGDIWFQTA